MSSNDRPNQHSALGAEGREFESRRPDQTNQAVTPSGASADPTKTLTETPGLRAELFDILPDGGAFVRLRSGDDIIATLPVRHPFIRSAQQGEPGASWLIVFEDPEMRPEVFTDRQAAEWRLRELSVNWDVHLYANEPALMAENQRLRRLVHGLLAQAHEPSSSRGNEIALELDTLGFGGAQ